MDFKPTKWKIIVSIIAALIGISWSVIVVVGCGSFLVCLANGIPIGIFLLVIVYVIWSLFQKK